MDASLTALSIVLERLGMHPKVETIDDRKLLQKSVYLAQAIAGVNLGYRFSWYLKGPYSPALAHDYYALAEAEAWGEEPDSEVEIADSAAKRLAEVKDHLLVVPQHVTLSKPDWSELIASIDYLRRVSNLPEEQSREILQKQKPLLFRFYAAGKGALEASSAQ